MTTIIDGKKISRQIKDEIAQKVNKSTTNGNRPPHLSVVLIGDDPASWSYVKNKEKSSRQVGFTSSLLHFKENISEQKLLEVIEQLNNDSKVDGFIVQLPLPSHIDEQKVILSINPQKDVDGFHPLNLGKMLVGLPGFLPATPYGILELINRYNIKMAGKQVLVIGRSLIVGRPLSILLSQKRKGGNATVTLAHSKTKNLKHLSRKADVVITALGVPGFLTADMVKEGVVIIDAGINSVPDTTSRRAYRLVGDVDFDNVSQKASYITPVPGGVGPMTVAMLLKNNWKAYEQKIKTL